MEERHDDAGRRQKDQRFAIGFEMKSGRHAALALASIRPSTLALDA
jgi:hypothetical protein